MNSPNTTLCLAYAPDPKASKAKQHSVIHFYQRPDGVRIVEYTYWPTADEARAVVAGGTR